MAGDNGFRVMAYDAPAGTPWNPGENAHFVVVEGDTTEEIGAYRGKLADGGAVPQPPLPAQWAPPYGTLKDRFGVVWVLSAVHPG